MLRLLFCLWMALPTYPPDQAIVLSEDSRLTLRWNVPGRSFRVELWEAGGPVQSQLLEQSSWTVSVRPGGDYIWRVTPLGARPSQNHFSVARDYAYHADGRTGSPGKNGSNGGQLRLRLAQSELWIWDRERQLHFVGLDQRKRFLISARGGDGGKGQDGVEFAEPEAARGQAGGAAGWGGTVEVSTRDAPWRQYLEIDVSGGEGGTGGQGGRYYRNGVLERGADGAPGAAGRPGRVLTTIEH
ncbi:MAG: hypothetical protein U0931_28280 [Vulcanimicrobiota bacterium]